MHPNTRSIISELIKIRKERGLTQKALAEIAGVMAASMSNWEQFTNVPSFDSVCRWASALDYELDLHLKDPSETGERDSQWPSANVSNSVTTQPEPK